MIQDDKRYRNIRKDHDTVFSALLKKHAGIIKEGVLVSLAHLYSTDLASRFLRSNLQSRYYCRFSSKIWHETFHLSLQSSFFGAFILHMFQVSPHFLQVSLLLMGFQLYCACMNTYREQRASQDRGCFARLGDRWDFSCLCSCDLEFAQLISFIVGAERGA